MENDWLNNDQFKIFRGNMSLTVEKRYNEAVSFATAISKDMAWIQANREILKHSTDNGIRQRMVGTYAGNAWITLRRTILNEIHIGLSRVLIDEVKSAVSLPRLQHLLKDEEMLAYAETKYTQAAGTFKPRLRELKVKLRKLNSAIKAPNSDLNKLIRHRNQYMAHMAAKKYTGEVKLKWGDEEKLIEIAECIISPMEHIFLNVGNRSKSTGSAYKTYAKEFWASFHPNGCPDQKSKEE